VEVPANLKMRFHDCRGGSSSPLSANGWTRPVASSMSKSGGEAAYLGASPPKAFGADPPLKPKSFRNQNAVEQIKEPLHQKREQRRRNRALQNCRVVVQI